MAKLVKRNVPKECSTQTGATDPCCTKGLPAGANVGLIAAVGALLTVVCILKACGVF